MKVDGDTPTLVCTTEAKGDNMFGNSLGSKIITAILSLMVTVVLLITGNMFQRLEKIETNIQYLREFAARGDRFTQTDAMIMERRIKSELPPEWLLDRMTTIDKELDRQQLQIDRLEGWGTDQNTSERSGLTHKKLRKKFSDGVDDG